MEKLNPLSLFFGEDTDPLIKVSKQLSADFDETLLFPENSTHPKKQKQKAREIVERVNKGTTILVVTHSNYILVELNNLLLFGQLSEVMQQKVIKEIGYKKEHILLPHQVSASLVINEEEIERLNPRVDESKSKRQFNESVYDIPKTKLISNRGFKETINGLYQELNLLEGLIEDLYEQDQIIISAESPESKGGTEFNCLNCKFVASFAFDTNIAYCPKCGTKMLG